MPTIQASVNARLLTKAGRFFTGTLEGRIIEILQNARRAGASSVEIIHHADYVTVRDNGRGVDDFANLLDLGGSGWDEAREASEDPAGVGLFCLAPREVLIRSKGGMACIAADGWTGAPVTIEDDPESIDGTLLRFHDDEWGMYVVERLAVFTGMKVTVDGQPCAQASFVSGATTHHPELGCRIEVREADELDDWHRRVREIGAYNHDVLVNFHGQVVSFPWHPVREKNLLYLVDLTGAPTDIRLMLPARTCLVENPAMLHLREALEIEAFRYLQRRGHHQLPYKQFLRGRQLGIELPEATPTYHVGSLMTGDAPDPVAVKMPPDFPLSRCYRFDVHHPEREDTDDANVHCLAALGSFDEPFVPVTIHQDYYGYSWTKLPTVEGVTVTYGKELHEADVWGGLLTCVETLHISAETSDGREFTSNVCMALTPSPEDGSRWAEPYVLVTREALQRLSSAEIWHALGGWIDDGDTYDTQWSDFEAQLDRFWADLHGPDEHLRRRIFEALAGIRPEWKTVHVTSAGSVQIGHVDGSTRTIEPPAAIPAA